MLGWVGIVAGVVVMVEVTVVIERLTFPPAAVYHTSKMHSHTMAKAGHNRGSA